MYYQHEEYAHKQSAYTMCTELPTFDPSATASARCAEYLEDRELDANLAKDNGWFPSTDAGDSFLRIVIPAVTHKPGHVYWQARDVTGNSFLRYQSSKGQRHEALIKVMPKGKPKGIVVLEGPCCALAAAMEGYVGYALMGMNPSLATMRYLALLIEDHPTLRTLVCLDRGETSSAVKVAMFIASQGCKSAVAELPEKDLAQCKPLVRRKFLDQSFSCLFR